jgi:hypothetical protein
LKVLWWLLEIKCYILNNKTDKIVSLGKLDSIYLLLAFHCGGGRGYRMFRSLKGRSDGGSITLIHEISILIDHHE